MISKTPQFDAALDAILKPLVPHERVCAQCKTAFKIEAEDIEFYRMLRVPPPTLCSLCRKKRRFGHLMRVPKFFKRPCQAPGHAESVVSILPPEAPHHAFDFAYWHSDAWDAAAFGMEYNASEPFFPQFRELFFTVPHVSLDRDPAAVDADYSVGGTASKNVYCSGMVFKSEDVRYCYDSRYSRDLTDCSVVSHSERCYQSVGSWYCNQCLYVVGCSHYIDCSFLYDCKNCSHCFLSSNLRNRFYVFRNQELPEAEYKKRVREFRLSDRDRVNALRNEFEGVMKNALHRSVQTTHVMRSIGDSIAECKQCSFVFKSEKSENIRYGDNLVSARDSMDDLNNVQTERLYEVVVIGWGNENRFSMYLRHSSSLEYCSECLQCSNCFGCVGLKNKQFHIFNVLYAEDEYWERVDELKTAMLARGEYGEFFPSSLGLFPYQSSNAQKEFPLTEAEAKRQGIPWYDEPASDIPTNMRLRRAPGEVPADIKDVTDEILNEAIVCEASGKPFRITKNELEFYRRMNLPLPTKHPWERMQERAKWEHRVWLYPFTCPKCGEQSSSVYTEEEQKQYRIYCEKCYLKEVV